jgi:sodium transport system permease protein
LVVAALPAICEELAFRGFILSGLRHMGHKWTAIIISSVFFGAAHAIFQQSLIACLMGMVIGFIAIQTGSLLPGVLFHVIHNSMALLVQQFAPALRTEHAWLSWLILDPSEQGPLYAWPVVAVSLIVSAALLYWFHKLPYAHTPEESLQEAIEHQSAHWLPG